MSPKERVIGHIICEVASLDMFSNNLRIVGESAVDKEPIGEGPIQDTEQVNRNRRMYLTEDMAKELLSERLNELLSTGNLYGEAGHPTSPELSRQQVIMQEKTTHKFTKVWMEGNIVMARFTPSEFPLGDAFRKVLLNGTLPAFSLRALGTIVVNEKGISVVKNLKILTWDYVIYPSHKIAYMKGLVTESTNMNQIVDHTGRPIYSGDGSLVAPDGNRLYVETAEAGLITPITDNKVISYIKDSSRTLKSTLESMEFLYEKIEASADGSYVTLHGKSGDRINLMIEQHITNEIMNYCHGLRR